MKIEVISKDHKSQVLTNGEGKCLKNLSKIIKKNKGL